VLDFYAGDMRAVHRSRGAHALALKKNSSQVRKRPAGTNDVRAAPIPEWQGAMNVLANVLAEFADVPGLGRRAEKAPDSPATKSAPAFK